MAFRQSHPLDEQDGSDATLEVPGVDRDMARVVAIVPARGGSKGLPGKNIAPFLGAPLIAWSIAAGLKATTVDQVICSTDDDAIRDIALSAGAEVPFMRPAEIAADHSTDLELFQHALLWFRDNEGYVPEIVVQLRPTTPLRQAHWIDECVEMLLADPSASSVRSVTPAHPTPYKMWKRGADNVLTPLMTVEGVPEPFNMPRQSLPEAWWQTAHIDVIRSETILSGSMTGSKILAYLVDSHLSVDIDTEADFRLSQITADAYWDEIVRPEMARRG